MSEGRCTCGAGYVGRGARHQRWCGLSAKLAALDAELRKGIAHVQDGDERRRVVVVCGPEQESTIQALGLPPEVSVVSSILPPIGGMYVMRHPDDMLRELWP